MTEKELRKLHRHDLLELLVEQSRETVRLGTLLKERNEELAASEAGNERLKAKLNEKDEQIEKLEGRLNDKDSGTEEQLNRLKEKLNEKDALIEKLKGRLDEKDAAMAQEAARNEETFGRLKGKLDEKDVLIDKLRTRLDGRDEKIETLEAEVANLRSDRWKELQKSGFPPELLAGLKALL